MREVMQQALDALKRTRPKISEGSMPWILHDRAITALCTALEQPEQRCEYIRTSGNTHWCALSEREWQGLTDEERANIYATTEEFGHEIARAVEAALKEKNK